MLSDLECGEGVSKSLGRNGKLNLRGGHPSVFISSCWMVFVAERKIRGSAAARWLGKARRHLCDDTFIRDFSYVPSMLDTFCHGLRNPSLGRWKIRRFSFDHLPRGFGCHRDERMQTVLTAPIFQDLWRKAFSSSLTPIYYRIRIDFAWGLTAYSPAPVVVVGMSVPRLSIESYHGAALWPHPVLCHIKHLSRTYERLHWIQRNRSIRPSHPAWNMMHGIRIMTLYFRPHVNIRTVPQHGRAQRSAVAWRHDPTIISPGGH